MASDLTNLQAHTRSAELHRRAEFHRLYRLAAKDGASERERVARPTRPFQQHLGSLAEAVGNTVARFSAALGLSIALCLIAIAGLIVSYD